MKRTRLHRPVHTLLGLLFLALMLFPVYWMVNASLQPGVATVDLDWFPVRPSLEGYRNAVASQGANLARSLVVSVGAVLVSLAVATPAAYALSLVRVRGAGAVMFALLLSQMIPGIVIAILIIHGGDLLPADLRYPLSAISLATKIPLAEAWEREWVTPLPSPIT